MLGNRPLLTALDKDLLQIDVFCLHINSGCLGISYGSCVHQRP